MREVDLSTGKVLAPFLSMVIHGLLDTCSYVFKIFAFQNVSGFCKSFFERFLNNSCISPQECLKNCFESFLKSVGVKRCFVLFLKRASIYESSTYPKELSCVNVLKVVPSHH